MKKMIDFKQLIELDDNQKEQLVKWWNAKKDNTQVPLLTVGDMIELLVDYNFNGGRFCLAVTRGETKITSNGNPCTDDGETDGYYDTAEICDTLWEAVKTAIKN